MQYRYAVVRLCSGDMFSAGFLGGIARLGKMSHNRGEYLRKCRRQLTLSGSGGCHNANSTNEASVL